MRARTIVAVAAVWTALLACQAGVPAVVPPPPSDAGFTDNGGPPPPDAGTPAPPPDAGIPAPPPPDAGQQASIDPYRELLIVDSSVVLDARASNAGDGPWSFRFLLEQMAAPGQRAGDLAEQWLRSFRQTSIEGAAVEDRKGVEEILADWPRTPGGELDLAQAPFRLLAVIDRVDLVSSANGEARFVYGLVNQKTGKPDSMAVAFEYRLPALGTSNDRQEWARRWHKSGELPFGSAYNAALESITRLFAIGSSLSQIRTNEGRFGAIWEMRQWVLDGKLLRPARLPQTPLESLNGNGDLARFISSNDAAVRKGVHQIPETMLAGAASELGNWEFKQNPEIDPALRHAFAVRTCNGCHASETNSLQGFFHVNPFAPIVPGSDGRDRLSDYLKVTQMGQRVANLQSLLAGGAGVAEQVPPLPAGPAAPLYDAIEIPAPADSAAIALGRDGRVLGNSSNGPWIHDGAIRFLSPGAGRQMFAMGFNRRGDVVGFRVEATRNVRRGFAIIGGVYQELGTLGGDSSAANLIDDAGRIAGDSTLRSGSSRSFIVDGSPGRALFDLGTLGGDETLAFAINSLGQVTGQSQRAGGERHPFLFDGSSMRDLGSLGGAFGRAQAVNDAGQAAGMSELVPGDRKIHAFFHDGNSMRDLGALPGLPWTSATGLNNAGVVVGNVYNKPDYNGAKYETFAFVYRDGTLSNLNDLIPPSKFVLFTSLGIDDAGRILCTDGQAGQLSARAYLLTPR